MANMTQQMALDELYNRWFHIADHDRDGRVMGQEAVAFLTRSGLPPATLGKIWEVAAQGAPWLDQASFRRVCQLMWYAQQHGNDLPADSRGVVMKIISGMATLPPPKMQGEEPPFALRDMRPIGIEMPQPAQQFSQAPSYMSHPTGASSVATPGMHAPQHSQTASGTHFHAGSTGQSFTSGQTGGVPPQAPSSMAAGQTGGAPGPGSVAVGSTGQPQFPDITTFLATKYGDMFKAANKDPAGDIPGGEVLRLLGTSPTDISVKKQAWDMVAGGKGALNAQEFFTMLYLLDVHTVNKALPESIPSGIFPPGVHQCFSAAGLPVPGSLQPPTVAHVPLAQQNPVENLALDAEMHKDEKWSMAKHQEEEHDPLAALPAIPPKQTYEAPDEQPYNAESRLPAVDSKMTAALSNASERERLQSSVKAATKLDRELHEAEIKFANAQQENEFYVASLQQLTIFKGRSERALLDTQSRADSAHRDAQETRQRYEQMYSNMRAQASTAQDLQRHITEAMASKAEWESKVAVLQQELQALANATPELLEQLQYEVEELKYAVGVSEAEKRAFEDQTAGLRASKAQLEDRVKTVKDEMKTTQELMEEALISLNSAKQELDFTKTGEDAESLQAALEEAAAAYKALHIKALSAGVLIPKEAMVQSNEHSVWSKEDLIGARDWMKFADAGWTVMEDLPELPEIFDTTFYIAHNQSEPPEVIVPIIMSDDPFIEAEDIEDAPAPAKPAIDSSGAAVAAQPAAAAAAAAPTKDGKAVPAADENDAATPAAGEEAAAAPPEDSATPGAVAEAVEPSGAPAVDDARAAPTAAQPSAGPFNASSTVGPSPDPEPAEPKGPAPLPADLFSGQAPAPDPELAAPPASAAAPALGASAAGQRSFETFIPHDSSAPVSGDPSRTPSNAAGGLPTSVDISAQPSETLSAVSQSVALPGLTGALAGAPAAGAVGDTVDILKVAPTPAPTAELSLPLGPSTALGGPGSPPETTTDIQKLAPTPAPTAELSNSSALPGAGRTVASLGVPSLAAAAAAAACGTAAGDTTDITNAAPTPAPTAELSNSTYLPGKPAIGTSVPSLAAAAAAVSATAAGDTTDITASAPTPAPTAELSNSSLLPSAGRTVDSMGVPSLAAAAAAAASSGAAAASGPLNGGQSGTMPPTLSIPEQEDSVPMLAQGIPPTPGSTGALATPPSRSVKSSLSNLAKHTSAATGDLSGALPGVSGRLMAPTPANSAALSMAGNSGLIDPNSGQPYPGARGMPQRGTPLSLSQVADKLKRSDVGSGSSTNLATPTYDPGELGSAPGPPQVPQAGPPGVLPEESTEILEISASLPLPQAPQQQPRTSGTGGTPPAVFLNSNSFGQQAAPDANDSQPPAPPGPVAEGASELSTSLLGGTDSVFGWPDAGVQSSGSGRKHKASASQAAEQGASKVTGKAAWNNEFQ